MPDDREDTNLAERSLELDSIELAAAIFGSGDQNIHLPTAGKKSVCGS